VLSPCASSCWASSLATTTPRSMRVASADIQQELPVSYVDVPSTTVIRSSMYSANATPFASSSCWSCTELPANS
jgi:hypothetical protein